MEEKDNPTLFSYCIPIDDGAAPNPYWGICTLTICKPVIRRVAKVGDWVVGIGSKNSPIGDISNHVVYAMKITKKLSMQKYDDFCKKKYPKKIPDWHSGDFRHRVGDCIYDFSDRSNPKIRKSVHTEKNKEKDLNGKYALISDHFYYFGDNPIPLPDYLEPIIKEDQGHKSKSNNPYVNDFISWIEKLPYKINSINGEPQLKEEIIKTKDICSICSDGRLDEAIKDEDIGLENFLFKFMIGTIDLTTLQKIFQSEDFLKDIKELSSWGANIKQEAPILHIMAKLLSRNGHRVTLELKTKSKNNKKIKYDMMINGTIIEAKFYYEEDIYQKIRRLLEKTNYDINLILDCLKEKKPKEFQFQPIWYILRDIFYKKPDIFILIFLSRYLLNVSNHDLEIINWTDKCLRYNKNFGYNNQETFKILNKFLKGLKEKKYYEDCYVSIDINTKFPSTYHIYLMDFRNKDK